MVLSLAATEQNSHSQTKNSYTSEVNVVAGKCGMLAGKQARMHYVVSERQLGLDGYQHK